MADHRPTLFGARAAFFLFITDLFCFSLHHISQIYGIFQYLAYGRCCPNAFRLSAAVLPLLGQCHGRGQYTAAIQHCRHTTTGKSHEIQPKDTCYHLRSLRARHQYMMVKRTFLIAIRGIIPQILPPFPVSYAKPPGYYRIIPRSTTH